MSFRKTDQNGGVHGKIKQIFKVDKLNPQQEETLKILLDLIKLDYKYTYWFHLSHGEYNNLKKARIFIKFHNNTY